LIHPAQEKTMSTLSNVNVTEEVIAEIQRAIEQLRFGSVEITVHEGRVTQIEKREKVRFGQDAQRIKPTAPAAASNH
jgi:hypothetical protein